MNAPSPRLRARPTLLRALGPNEPPRVVTVNGGTYELAEVFKHDSWAATGTYRGPHGMIVVKFNREQSLGPLPMKWLGYRLARREARALQLLGGIAGVPRDAGAVFTNETRRHSAIAHFYMAGHPLHIDEHPSADFFARLERLVKAMHERGLAYVDLNKRENVIVLDDGTPTLVDFQLHFAPSKWALQLPLVHWLFDQARSADLYHLAKHLAWHRPDLSSASTSLPRRPLAIRVWRAIFVSAIQSWRRRLLIWLRVRDKTGLAVSELYPEKAARLALERKARDPGARLPGRL